MFLAAKRRGWSLICEIERADWMQRWKSTRGNCFPKFCPDVGGAALFDLRAMLLFDSFRRIPGSVEKVCRCFVEHGILCVQLQKINQEERKIILFINLFAIFSNSKLSVSVSFFGNSIFRLQFLILCIVFFLISKFARFTISPQSEEQWSVKDR